MLGNSYVRIRQVGGSRALLPASHAQNAERKAAMDTPFSAPGVVMLFNVVALFAVVLGYPWLLSSAWDDACHAHGPALDSIHPALDQLEPVSLPESHLCV